RVEAGVLRDLAAATRSLSAGDSVLRGEERFSVGIGDRRQRAAGSGACVSVAAAWLLQRVLGSAGVVEVREGVRSATFGVQLSAAGVELREPRNTRNTRKGNR